MQTYLYNVAITFEGNLSADTLRECIKQTLRSADIDCEFLPDYADLAAIRILGPLPRSELDVITDDDYKDICDFLTAKVHDMVFNNDDQDIAPMIISYAIHGYAAIEDDYHTDKEDRYASAP